MSREIRIPHDKIRNPQTLTREFEERFRAEGLDLHVHEVEKIDEDDKRGERVLQVKNTKYFF